MGSQTDVFLKKSQKVTNTVHGEDVFQVIAEVCLINTVLPDHLKLAPRSCRLNQISVQKESEKKAKDQLLGVQVLSSLKPL